MAHSKRQLHLGAFLPLGRNAIKGDGFAAGAHFLDALSLSVGIEHIDDLLADLEQASAKV